MQTTTVTNGVMPPTSTSVLVADLTPELIDAEKYPAARAAMNFAWDKLSLIESAERQVDSLIIWRESRSVVESVVTQLGNSIQSLEQSDKAATAKLEEVFKPKDVQLAAEVRAWVKEQKSPATRIMQLLRGDPVQAQLVASAVASVPPFLLGLEPEAHTEIRRMAATLLAPDQVATLESNAKVRAKLQRAIELITSKAKDRLGDMIKREMALGRIKAVTGGTQ